MFGGKEKEISGTRPSIPTPASITGSQSSKSNHSNQSQITAYLGPDVHIEGVLRFDNSVLIEGTFKGEIHSQGSLVIGESAEVDAKIVTRTITIKGSVKGTVEAKERVELKSQGSLQGDVITPSLQMDETVFFQGSCSMPGSSGSSSGSSSNSSSSQRREEPKQKTKHVESIVDAVHSSID